MPKPFPPIILQTGKKGDEDYNPAIRLFGRRFFDDQTVAELLVEFLLIAASAKRIGQNDLASSAVLPDMEQLRLWGSHQLLYYAPKARLNLKLFAFLGASKLETRHESHRQHYRDFIRDMRAPEKMSLSGTLDPDEVIKTLENLFSGFQSVGGQRTWCAQAFLPVARSVIGGETLWNETEARRSPGTRDWPSVLHFFSFNRHRFLARGGELLYFQVCNALKQDGARIRTWAKASGISLSPREAEPSELHATLAAHLASVLDACPETVGKLAEFLDTGIDSQTARKTDFQAGGHEPRFATCGWCPEESWPEGILFCIELLHICDAVLDPIERIEMLELACAMQALRSLCAQSARYASRPSDTTEGAGPLGFVWTLSNPSGDQQVIKRISQRTLGAVQRLIHDAIRHPNVLGQFRGLTEEELAKVYRDADETYGHKLFLTLAKRIGFVVPKRGGGARFVLNDKLLRFLVLAIVRPGTRITYEGFKGLMFAHYGLAVDDERIALSCRWSGTASLTSLGSNSDAWLLEMLDASGVLIRLSDSCSLVINPFEQAKEFA